MALAKPNPQTIAYYTYREILAYVREANPKGEWVLKRTSIEGEWAIVDVVDLLHAVRQSPGSYPDGAVEQIEWFQREFGDAFNIRRW